VITIRFPDHFPVRATEWMLAAMKTSWGFLLLLPYPIFHQPMMVALARMADQRTWGSIAFVAGSLHLIALYVNGTRRKSPHVRAICSGIGALFWIFVCRGMYAPGIPSTGWAIYPWLVIFSFRNVWTAMEDARRSDERFKSEGATGGRS
jgi:hypothetical protein